MNGDEYGAERRMRREDHISRGNGTRSEITSNLDNVRNDDMQVERSVSKDDIQEPELAQLESVGIRAKGLVGDASPHTGVCSELVGQHSVECTDNGDDRMSTIQKRTEARTRKRIVIEIDDDNEDTQEEVGVHHKDVSTRQKDGSEYKETQFAMHEGREKMATNQGTYSFQRKSISRQGAGHGNRPSVCSSQSRRGHTVKAVSGPAGTREKGVDDFNKKKMGDSIEQGAEQKKETGEENSCIEIDLDDESVEPEPVQDHVVIEIDQEEVQMPSRHPSVREKGCAVNSEKGQGGSAVFGEYNTRFSAAPDESTKVGSNEKKINSFLEQVHGFDRNQSDVIEIDDDSVIEIDNGGQSCEIEQPHFDAVKYGSPGDLEQGQHTPQETVEVESLDQNKERVGSAMAKRKRFKPHKKRSKLAKTAKDNQVSKENGQPGDKQSSKDADCSNEQHEKHEMKEDENNFTKYDNRASQQSSKQKTKLSNITTERRYVFHPMNNHRTSSQRTRYPTEATKTTWFERNFSYNFSHDDALKEQERLFKESAARMRSQAQFRVVSHALHHRPRVVKFNAPVIDIEKRHPNHWQFSDPYARLGLPNDAATHLVKSQYRRLALIYHPDKSRTEGTATKFQAVTEAYRALLGT
jgi:hypothetical protein